MLELYSISGESLFYQYEHFVKVEPGDTVLDLGCSYGYFYYEIFRRNVSYYGIDGDLHILNEFVTRCKRYNFPIPYLLHAFIDIEPGVIEYRAIHPPYQLQRCHKIPFHQLLEQIDKPIDFLKFDIESFEYALWAEKPDYHSFINGVKKFSGELHFLNGEYTKSDILDCLQKLRDDDKIELRLFSIDGVELYHPDMLENKTEVIISGRIV